MAQEREHVQETSGINRTGLMSSAHAERMTEDTHLEPEGEAGDFLRFRASFCVDAPPIGSHPMPISIDAAVGEAAAGSTSILIDKVGERLAFERTGTRLYDTLLLKHEATGGFQGGPSFEELLKHRDEEFGHFQTLSEVLEQLGGDPTAVTPSADVAGVASSGIVALIADARSTLPQCLEAMLAAELVDESGWGRLIELCTQLGHRELTELFEQCARTEAEHLLAVQGWLRAGMQALTEEEAENGSSGLHSS
jgi:hypothetical protein